MLTILDDPAGITGRRRIAWGAGTAFEQIARAMPEGGGDAEVRWNGERIDPLSDPRMNEAPSEADDVVVVHRPAGLDPVTWIAIASVVLAAYSYTLIPKPTDQPQQSDSPNNRLTGQTNIARAYQAIPDVYGLRRVWPDLIQPSTVEYIENVKVITEWLCVSRGKGTISAVKYADTPITDIEGGFSQVFEPSVTPNTYPEDNDTTLEDVYEAFESPEVNGQELTDAPGGQFILGYVTATSGDDEFTFEVPDQDAAVADMIAAVGGQTVITTSVPEPFSELCTIDSYSFSGGLHVFTLTRSTPFGVTATSELAYLQSTVVGSGAARGPYVLGAEANQIWCNFAFLRGLVGNVEIQADWVAIDSSGAAISGTEGTETTTLSASSYDQRFFTWKIIPSAGLRRYRISFTRLTADLGNGADVCKLEEVYAVRYYATKTLPGVTVVKVTTRATSQAIGFQDRKFNLVFNRHVRTLTSTTLSASRNFARALVHLWAVQGYSVSEWDTTALQAINTALGEDSPFLRFDWSFDDANLSLGERLQIIANAARCVVWRDGTQWTVTRDQVRTTPELQLDYRNLAASGDSAISYGAHLPGSEDGIEVEFIEEAEQLRKDYVRLDISSGSIVEGASENPKRIKLLGCATSAQARNRAYLEAGKLLYQRTSVSDTALADAATLGPGSLVRWIDPHDFYADDGLQGGEVVGISGSVITASEPLRWNGETTGRMIFTGVDGSPLGAAVTCTPSGDRRAILSSVPGGLYVRDDTKQLGSRFAFGAGLTAAEIEAAGLYTVTEVRPSSDRTVALSLVNYDARIYAQDNSLPVGLAQETDAALALGSNTLSVGVARETDRAFALDGVQLSDPNFANVSFLAHMHGTNGSTSFTDSSSIGHTITAAGNAQIDTSTSPYSGGISCGLFDGTGDYLEVADAASLDFGTGDFTVEGWVRAASFTSVPFLWHKLGAGSGANAGWFIEVDASNIYAGKGVASLGADFAAFACSLSTGVWYHIAITRTGNTLECFLGGASLGTFTPGGGGIANDVDNSSPMVLGGGGASFFTSNNLNGRLADWRVTKGVRRYTTTFTPPSSPYPDS